MRFEVPDTDTVYVSGLPPDTTETSLAEYFGSIGIIKLDKKTKKHKIWLYRCCPGCMHADTAWRTVRYAGPCCGCAADLSSVGK